MLMEKIVRFRIKNKRGSCLYGPSSSDVLFASQTLKIQIIMITVLLATVVEVVKSVPDAPMTSVLLGVGVISVGMFARFMKRQKK